MIWIIILCVGFLITCIKYFVLEKLKISSTNKKHVFITGCDTGFGHFLALKLAAAGIPTFAGCLTERGRIELHKLSRTYPGKLWTLNLDVTDDTTIQNAKNFVQNHLKETARLWGLVCNAGIADVNAPDDWLNVDDYKKIVDVNTFGVIRVCQTFKPLIKKSKGRIVIMTAGMARLALPGCGPYVVSKFGAGAYADLLRLETKPFGVTVHVVEPGFFKTNIADPQSIANSFDILWNRLKPEIRTEYGKSYYQKTKEAMFVSLPRISSNKIHFVVDAYFHALTSRFPRSRYKVGYDMMFVFAPITLFPAFLQDKIVQFLLWTQKAPLPEATYKKL